MPVMSVPIKPASALGHRGGRRIGGAKGVQCIGEGTMVKRSDATMIMTPAMTAIMVPATICSA